MRILTGEFKGRRLVGPKTASTRPLSEKLRAAIFDVVGDIWQFDVIDAYAGSGAVGLEALSRGARSVWAIESDKQALAAIKANLATCGFADEGGGAYLGPGAISYELTTRPLEQAVKGPSEFGVQLIIADPPYEQLDEAVLSHLAGHLDKSGVMVVSHASKIEPPELKSLQLVKSKTYGDSALVFYKAAA